jgi:hypothetical protein
LLRETKDGIGESYLVCVKEEEAKKIATEYANFINKEFGVEENLTEKHKSLLGCAITTRKLLFSFKDFSVRQFLMLIASV